MILRKWPLERLVLEAKQTSPFTSPDPTWLLAIPQGAFFGASIPERLEKSQLFITRDHKVDRPGRLLDCYGLCQVARLIHIGAFEHGDVIGK